MQQLSKPGELMPQLSQSAPPPTEEEITEIINHDAATLLLARGKIFRFYDLDSFPDADRLTWIEDVVVDENCRGRGVGEALNRRAIELALAAGAAWTNLSPLPLSG